MTTPSESIQRTLRNVAAADLVRRLLADQAILDLYSDGFVVVPKPEPKPDAPTVLSTSLLLTGLAESAAARCDRLIAQQGTLAHFYDGQASAYRSAAILVRDLL